MNLVEVVTRAGQPSTRYVDGILIEIFPGRLTLRLAPAPMRGNLNLLVNPAAPDVPSGMWESKFTEAELTFRCSTGWTVNMQTADIGTGRVALNLVGGRFSIRSQDQSDKQQLQWLHARDQVGQWKLTVKGDAATFEIVNKDAGVEAMSDISEAQLETDAVIEGTFDPKASRSKNLENLKKARDTKQEKAESNA